MKQIFYLLALSALFYTCKNDFPLQNSKNLLVNAEIVGRAYCCADTNSFENLIVKIDVSNNSKQEKSFWIMKCSWVDSFRTNREDIFLNKVDCVGNYPIEIKLDHNQDLTLYTTLERRSRRDSFDPDTFRIGLMLFDENDFSHFERIYKYEYQKTRETYWSNLLTFEDYVNGYKMSNKK